MKKSTKIPVTFSFYPEVIVHAIPKRQVTKQELRKLQTLVINIEDKLEEELHKKAKTVWMEMLGKIKVDGLTFNKKSGKLYIHREKQ